MKLKDVYSTYKNKYQEYIILIKCGNFYEILGEDAEVANTIFNYKIKELSNIKKAGFPIIALNRVVSRLDSLKVNYLVIENGQISDKRRFNRNKYKQYLDKPSNIDRINLIYNKLLEKKNTNIDQLLDRIESML